MKKQFPYREDFITCHICHTVRRGENRRESLDRLLCRSLSQEKQVIRKESSFYREYLKNLRQAATT